MMPDKVEHYRKRLEAEKIKLMGELTRAEKPENFGNDVDDFSEEQEEAEALANSLAVGQALRDRISEIDSSLNKIETGKYGICDKCQREISDKELDLVPESRLCEHCK